MTSPLKVRNPFKTKEEKFLVAVEQVWNECGQLPTKEKLITMEVINTDDDYEALLGSPFVQKALDELGIKFEDSLILTPKQLAAVQIMFDFTDGRSDTKKLRDLGLNTQTWQNWLQDPSFQTYLRSKASNLFKLNLHEVDRALFARARSGDISAIKILYAITGHNKSSLEESEVPKIGPIDANTFVLKIYEILHNNLHLQPEVLIKIGREIAAISSPYMNNPKVIEAVQVISSGSTKELSD